MSRLALYCPPSADEMILRFDSAHASTGRKTADTPVILSFANEVEKIRPGYLNHTTVTATCPDCAHEAATPVTLNDGSVVGHCCCDCGREWPVIPRANGVG